MIHRRTLVAGAAGVVGLAVAQTTTAQAAEDFYDIVAVCYYKHSAGFNEDLIEGWEYWESVEPKKEGQVVRYTDPSGEWLDTTYKSNRYKAGRGSSVSLIQTRLNANRHSGAPAKLTVDGVWGSATKAMVKWFQGYVNTVVIPSGSTTTHLTVDGLVGLRTWGYLK